MITRTYAVYGKSCCNVTSACYIAPHDEVQVRSGVQAEKNTVFSVPG